ncbi:exonuclease SbcCD subunit D [Mycetocola reblochoni]|uniref:Nuclease SbcCD subunit D n=2 Tax=Mycetocola reblochoni TaxID=331618 RepID=A0A1R4IIH4_9MICO|nr:exonuclease SbcCD subunit D [Mycetocola reblochoni]RLP69658.1 exonuclease SbcCD subunit D [Mycetocola reblochoni]SJN19555.1 Exonuclease SbcD [Mycetocola reblochoni REB411]
MRLMHSSDWHIGRRLHGAVLESQLDEVLGALVEQLAADAVDVLLVAGDVFDHAAPSAAAYRQLDRLLRAVRATGVAVVLIPGNHDSAARLGFQSGFASAAGVHVLGDAERLDVPVELADADGPVLIYGVPFLEPALLRRDDPSAGVTGQATAMRWAMDRIRADIDDRTGEGARPPRSVVLAHSFVAGVTGGDSERDITAGGVDLVPLDVFTGVDYVALGHLHSPSVLAEGVRYSGAPVHYSFTEAGNARGSWLVDLGPDGLDAVAWRPLPVPRPARTVTGTLEDVLARPAGEGERDDDWLRVILTDAVRPMDAMRRVQARYPHALVLEHRPPAVLPRESRYATATATLSDRERIAAFLGHVRDGAGPDDAERALIDGVLAELDAGERS